MDPNDQNPIVPQDNPTDPGGAQPQNPPQPEPQVPEPGAQVPEPGAPEGEIAPPPPVAEGPDTDPQAPGGSAPTF